MNVVDSLVVELKLDATNFDSGQKRTTEDFEKTKKKLEEHSKGINEQTDKMVSGFKRLGTEILSLFGIIASADAIKRFVEQTTDANSQLKLLGENLAFPARQMQTWAAAAREYGGSLDATVNSVQGLTDKLTALRTFGQDPGLAFWLLQGQKGGKSVNGPDNVQDTKNLADDIQLMFRNDPQKANLIGRQLGIDPGTLNAWERNGSGAGDQFSGQVPTKEALERSQQLQKAMADAATAIDNLAKVLVDDITPPLIAISNFMEKTAELFQKGYDPDAAAAAKKKETDAAHGTSPDAEIWNWIKGKASGILPSVDMKTGDVTFGGGAPVSHANPLPVIIAGSQNAAAGGFWSNLGGAIDKAFGGSGNAPSSAPPDSAPPTSAPAGNGWWGSVGKTLSGVFGSPANAALPPGGGVPDGASPAMGPGAGVGGWWTQERMKYAADRLVKEAGLSQVGAAGLVARWAAIEAAAGPAAKNNLGGGHAGIGQWDSARGGPAIGNAPFEDQVTHAVQELTTTEKRAGDALRNAKTAADAARGASMFERAEHYNPATGIDDWTSRTPVDRVYGQIYGGVADPNGPGGPNPYADLAPRSGYHWDNIQQKQVPNAAVPPFFGRNIAAGRPEGRFSEWAMDWGHTSATARAAMVGSGAVTNTTSSSEVNIGHIDLHSGATDAFGLAQDFARSLKEQSSAMGANYGAM